MEQAVAEAVAAVGVMVEQTWPVIVAIALGLFAFGMFRNLMDWRL